MCWWLGNLTLSSFDLSWFNEIHDFIGVGWGGGEYMLEIGWEWRTLDLQPFEKGSGFVSVFFLVLFFSYIKWSDALASFIKMIIIILSYHFYSNN